MKKVMIGIGLAIMLVAACPGAQAAVDPAKLAEAARNCPGLQGVDLTAMIAAINGCPAFQGMSEADIVKALQKCPALAGKGNPKDCPFLSGKMDPQAMAQAAAKCPALNGQLPPAAGPGKCPALNAPAGGQPLVKKAEATMQRVVKALERNKRSADVLIKAAAEAGADPKVVAKLEAMSQAFRQSFMDTVSPQQIIDGIIAQPAPEEPAGIIITGPDGTQWLVTPSTPQEGQMAPPPPPPGRRGGFTGPGSQGGKHGDKPRRQDGGFFGPGSSQPALPGAMQQRPERQGGGFFGPGSPMPQQAAPAMPQPTPPQAAPNSAPQAEVIIMEEETVSPMPLWPSKEDLGKDGVLKYLQKRQELQDQPG